MIVLLLLFFYSLFFGRNNENRVPYIWLLYQWFHILYCIHIILYIPYIYIFLNPWMNKSNTKPGFHLQSMLGRDFSAAQNRRFLKTAALPMEILCGLNHRNPCGFVGESPQKARLHPIYSPEKIENPDLSWIYHYFITISSGMSSFSYPFWVLPWHRAARPHGPVERPGSVGTPGSPPPWTRPVACRTCTM